MYITLDSLVQRYLKTLDIQAAENSDSVYNLKVLSNKTSYS
jgi:hypothetical protein